MKRIFCDGSIRPVVADRLHVRRSRGSARRARDRVGAKPRSIRVACTKLTSSSPAPTSSTCASASSPTTSAWWPRRTRAVAGHALADRAEIVRRRARGLHRRAEAEHDRREQRHRQREQQAPSASIVNLREPRQVRRRHQRRARARRPSRARDRRCRRAPRWSASRSAAAGRCAIDRRRARTRIEISACRVAAWPSSRCATFAHAISSSTATAICSSTISGRTSPTISSCSGTHVGAEAGVGRRIALRQRRSSRSSAAPAPARASRPRASRPITAMMCESRTAVMSPGNGKLRGMPRSPVIQTSPPATIGMSNAGGSTPTMVCGMPLRIIVLPSASAEPPNSWCHRPSVSTATRAASGRSSSAIITRPSLRLHAEHLEEVARRRHRAACAAPRRRR